MDLTIREIGKHRIIAFDGDLELFHMVKLKKQILAQLEYNPKSLVMDMARNNYIDSAGVAQIADLSTRMKDQGGVFALLNVNESVMEILRRTAVMHFVKIYKSEKELD